MAEERFKTAEKRFETANTGVFWDADVCKKPVGLDAVVVSQNIRSALRRLNYLGEVSIFAYGDSNKILGDLNLQTPVTIIKDTTNPFDYRGTSIFTPAFESTPTLVVNHTPAGDNEARLQRILLDFMFWTFDNPTPANVMLVLGDDISKREEFVFALNRLYSAFYNIHFAYPQTAQEPSGYPVDTKWFWESLSIGGTPLQEIVKSSPSVDNSRRSLQRFFGWSAFVGAIAAISLRRSP